MSLKNTLTITAFSLALLTIGLSRVEADNKDQPSNTKDTYKNEILPLLDHIKNGNDRERSNAFKKLEQLGPDAKTAIPFLISLSKKRDEDFTIMKDISEALLKIGPPTTNEIPDIVKLLNDDDSLVKALSVRMLLDAGSIAKDSVPALVKMLIKINPSSNNDIDIAMRKNIALALAEIDPSKAREAIPIWLELLYESDWDVVRIAARALGNTAESNPQLISSLTGLLRSKEKKDYKGVIFALGEAGTKAKGARKDVFRVMESGSYFTQNISWTAAGLMGGASKEEIPFFMEELKKPGINNVLILNLLGKSGPDAIETLPTVLSMLEDKNDEIRFPAALAALKIGGEKKAKNAMKILRKACEGGKGEICVSLAWWYFGEGNDAEANKLYRKACDAGSCNACVEFAVIEQWRDNYTSSSDLFLNSCKDHPLRLLKIAAVIMEKDPQSAEMVRNINMSEERCTDSFLPEYCLVVSDWYYAVYNDAKSIKCDELTKENLKKQCDSGEKPYCRIISILQEKQDLNKKAK